MTRPFNFVAAVLDAHLPAGADWRAYVEERAAQRGLRLEGEEVKSGDDFVAWARLYDPVAAEAAFGRAPWFSLEDRGEFRGRPVGFFSWEHYGASEEPFDRLAVFDLRGTIGRLDSGAAREPIVEARFPLDHLLTRSGFGDGDALLRLPGTAYDDAMARRIEQALERAGYPAVLGVGFAREVTSHNPVTLIGGLVRRATDGAELKASAELLAGAEVELLTYDLRLLSAAEREFWSWP